MNKLRRIKLLFIVLLVAGCSTVALINYDELYGEARVQDRIVAELPAEDVNYWSDVKPILNNRCTVCHGCYDAPCQLKTSSIEGIERGAINQVVYQQERLRPAALTRLHTDAKNTEGWREKGFHPVLNERAQTSTINHDMGVMAQILELKATNPLPSTKYLDDRFTLDLNRKQSCPSAESFNKYEKDKPYWGMPYALPGLSEAENNTILAWLQQGATYTQRAPLPDSYQLKIDEWEAYLNQDNMKAQLSSRYIYEHLFLANLHFDELNGEHYFRMVRSSTPPGEPLNIIATRRPYDAPGVERVYYRLEPIFETILAKTHMPYALNDKRKLFWNSLFFENDFNVNTLPSYQPDVASNPFKVYADIPADARYRFMLEEAQFTVMGFTKGPVCRGQVALNVINDHFWVFFVDPSGVEQFEKEDFYIKNRHLLELPSARENIYQPLRAWRHYRKLQKTFSHQKDKTLSENIGTEVPFTLDLIWDGDTTNDNATLTIFRHTDSATVEKGLLGATPKTAWVLGYIDLERIHYLLVAGYDVYGNVGHQVLSRLYMDFLRMDSEALFLTLLDKESRERERAYWYREANKEIVDYLTLPIFESMQPNGAMNYTSIDHKQELFHALKQKLQDVNSQYRKIASQPNASTLHPLNKLNGLTGKRVHQFPELTSILIEMDDGTEHVTLLRHQAHSNQTAMFREQNTRLPREDQLDIFYGFVGAYPNTLLTIKQDEIDTFVQMASAIYTAKDYEILVDRFGIRRTNPKFWNHSDKLHDTFKNMEPLAFGLLDLNRLENR